jgi:hypothetical protein
LEMGCSGTSCMSHSEISNNLSWLCPSDSAIFLLTIPPTPTLSHTSSSCLVVDVWF